MTEADWSHFLSMYSVLERLQLANIDLEDIIPITHLQDWLTKDMTRFQKNNGR